MSTPSAQPSDLLCRPASDVDAAAGVCHDLVGIAVEVE
jgi:hypothetical protein